MAAIAAPDLAPTLSAAEREQFHQRGFLGPYALCSPAEMAARTPAIERVLITPAPDHKQLGHNRHLDQRVIWDLASHPAIIGRMASVYGPDLLLWRTNFFIKHQDGKEIPWHQDYNYWPLEPAVIISAWIAVDRTSTENGCLQIIPGSHRKILPHVRATKDMGFGEMADPAGYDASQAINLEMAPGEFVLFNERTLHHSHANHSTKRRIGLAVRVIVPLVKVLAYDAPRHRLIQLCGGDPLGLNRLCQPPE